MKAIPYERLENRFAELSEKVLNYIKYMQYGSTLKFEGTKLFLENNPTQGHIFRITEGDDTNKDNSFMSGNDITGIYRDIGGSSKYLYIYVINNYTSSLTLESFARNGLVPVLDEESTRIAKLYRDLYNLSFVRNNKFVVNRDYYKDAIAGIIKTHNPFLNEVSEISETLLNCDTERIGVKPYDATILTEANRGHWDLFEDNETDYVGRDPHEDIEEDSFVSIDFGTKSTVVYYQDGDNNILPMPIGQLEGDSDNKKLFENPTIMRISSLKSFIEAYKAESGRPHTKWDDLQVSWTALQQFKDAPSKQISAYIRNIKQWAGGKKNVLRFRPIEDGNVETLKTFLEMSDHDFNPVEVYAYIIGLFINNMNSKIHLDYVLSFPVTYSDDLKNKMIKSFERGIKKSLPKAILDDKEVMSRFTFDGSISEPMAYAVTALEEYGFNFKEKVGPADVFYGIFDFGGGTIDYDFGVWSKNNSKKKPFAIQSYGGNGDGSRGGENLLEDLAYEVFKNNLDEMKGYPFHAGPNNKKDFIEYSQYCEESENADKNMQLMIEALREYWHNPDKLENCENNEDTIKLKVDLNDRTGDSKPNIELEFPKVKIKEFFHNNIHKAVESFFVEYQNKVANEGFDAGSELKIFLAGNSCRSPYVKEEFDNVMAAMGLNLEVFPPLGTAECALKMQECEIFYDANDKMRPDCKSGVAYGLIQVKTNIKVIKGEENQITQTFQYYLGYQEGQSFIHFEGDGNGKIELNKWYDYEIEADEKKFSFYYTKDPVCVKDELPLKETKSKICMIDELDEDAHIWIRATSLDTLEYTVSNGQPDDNKKRGITTITFGK